MYKSIQVSLKGEEKELLRIFSQHKRKKAMAEKKRVHMICWGSSHSDVSSCGVT